MWSKRWHGPAGVVWVNIHGTKPVIATVLESHVPKWCRRLGIRTALNHEILKICDMITTGSSESTGQAFMNAFGYTCDPDTHQWTYIKPKNYKNPNS